MARQKTHLRIGSTTVERDLWWTKNKQTSDR